MKLLAIKLFAILLNSLAIFNETINAIVLQFVENKVLYVLQGILIIVFAVHMTIRHLRKAYTLDLSDLKL